MIGADVTFGLFPVDGEKLTSDPTTGTSDRPLSVRAEKREESQTNHPLSPLEELHIFRTLTVSGRLKGELPPGFLSQFQDLPNELTLKIWSFLPKRQLRSFRLVSKHWKALWESTKPRKIIVYAMSISSEGGKYVVRTKTRHGFGRKVEINADAASIHQAFSLVTFNYQGVRDHQCHMLALEGAAANPVLLDCIRAAGWVFHDLAFKGDLRALTEEDLCKFLSWLTNCDPRGISLRFMDVVVDENVITDRVIEACSQKLIELVIILDPECAKKRPVKLTDRSLPFIVREGLMSVIPDASAFKNSSLKKAISDVLTDRMPPIPDSETTDKMHNNSMLTFPASCGFSMQRVAQLKVRTPGRPVRRSFYARVATLFEKKKLVSKLEFTQLTGGMVEYGFDRGPDRNRGIYTVDIAGPERMTELRSQYAIANIHIAESEVQPCFSYESFLGADYIADLSDYSGEYSGSHDYWDDYDGEYYDEVDEVDYEDYMGM
uniref:F-box domain-containing protein n=1 Tax=Parascaris univalens TaxID=6257 RepID=A0A915B034_PARUN